ncbi:MAG TPA: CopG family antitoxin [Thermoanaerobaculia bacterium]|nr:CopG family antitoxin [Thermoanaerobaculia bacterium]
MKRLNREELKLRQSVEKGQWQSLGREGSREITKYTAAAKATLRKNRRINIRINEADLEAIQERALEEGIPYQTLMASVLHKYATGRLG